MIDALIYFQVVLLEVSEHGMSEDAKTFFAKLPARDKELQEKRDEAFQKGQLDDVVKFAEARRLLYEEALRYPLRDLDKVLISNMASDAATRVIFYQMWKQFGEQAAAIISRLDNLETEVKELKEKINTG